MLLNAFKFFPLNLVCSNLEELLYHLTQEKKMDMPNSLLSHQNIQKKNDLSLRSIFFLFFMLSVGLNIYFVYFNKQTDVVERSQKIEQISHETSLPFQLEQSLKEITPSLEKQRVTVKPNFFKVLPEKTLNGQTIQSLSSSVRSSLSYTVCKIITHENGCAALSAHLGRLMAWYMDVKKEMRNGDYLDVLYQIQEGPEQFKILKLSYKSSFFGKTFEAFYFDEFDEGNGGYFNRDGKEIAQRIVESQSPIRHYAEITSLPGDFRKGIGGHSGTDFKAKVGTPIYSGFVGKVTRMNWNVRANGYCVEIDHPELEIKTLYLHLSRIKVKPGQTILAGQQIAESGNTGRSFAPHLHYEIQKRNNKKVIYNPFASVYHESYTRNIPAKDLNAFHKTLRQYNSAIQES